MPGGFEEQQKGQCSWSEVNENESERRGSWRTPREPGNVGHCEDLGFTLSEVGSSGRGLSGRVIRSV